MKGPVRVARVAVAAAGLIAACACAAPQAKTLVDPRVVRVAPHPWPTPRVAASDAKPQILALWMNETTIPSGSHWRGRIVTSTDVASVEIRTESFSFVAGRRTFGDFAFDQHVLDMVPFYKRGYLLHVIARNAAGERQERVVPIAFR